MPDLEVAQVPRLHHDKVKRLEVAIGHAEFFKRVGDAFAKALESKPQPRKHP